MARTAIQSVIRRGNRDCRVLFCFGIEDVKLAVQLVHDAALSVGAWPSHVPRLMSGYLCRSAAPNIISIEVKVTVAIRVEVNRVSNPHRVAIRARVVADESRVECLEIEDVELIRLPAAVTLFRSEVARLGRVNHLRAVG